MSFFQTINRLLLKKMNPPPPAPKGPPARPLAIWHEDIKKIPREEIIGGDSCIVSSNQAWIGDKQLNYHVSIQLYAFLDKSFNRGNATKIFDTAKSNSFLAKHATTILPGYEDAIEQTRSKHGLGTIVEAAFHRVGHDAKEDFASWLVKEAIIDVFQLHCGDTLEKLSKQLPPRRRSRRREREEQRRLLDERLP